MNRSTFIILLSIPFFSLAFVKFTPPIFLCACLYIIVLQFLRLSSKGLSLGQILLSYTPFGIRYWGKMWENDDVAHS
jgi:hypothetical protein